MKGDGGGTVMHDVCEVVATWLRIRTHKPFLVRTGLVGVSQRSRSWGEKKGGRNGQWCQCLSFPIMPLERSTGGTGLSLIINLDL